MRRVVPRAERVLGSRCRNRAGGGIDVAGEIARPPVVVGDVAAGRHLDHREGHLGAQQVDAHRGEPRRARNAQLRCTGCTRVRSSPIRSRTHASHDVQPSHSTCSRSASAASTTNAPKLAIPRLGLQNGDAPSRQPAGNSSANAPARAGRAGAREAPAVRVDHRECRRRRCRGTVGEVGRTATCHRWAPAS